ncbi:MAG: polysaccharide deacetylase [Firmicutes bacterium]|jgi:peptidoglycan/xylan/chitin deacetylase (PgdA/CDA1 family)|nr:polysaccharide deacetylase [Bacillota bacterium]
MEKHDFLKLLTLVLILLTIGGIFIIYSIHREAIIAHALTLLDESNLEGDSFNDSIPDEEAAGPNQGGDQTGTGSRQEENDLYAVGGSGPLAYLTFDDGPSINTGTILDVLGTYEVPATFFVIGKDNQVEEGIYRRIVDEGHVLGNHTYSHDYNHIYRSRDSFMNDLRRMEDLILEKAGIKTEIMRFPGGSSISRARRIAGYDIIAELTGVVIEEGYDYFDWNVDSGDGIASLAPEDILNNVLGIVDELQEDIVVLFHDRKDCEATVEVLPEIINQLLARGYEFASLYPGAIESKHR